MKELAKMEHSRNALISIVCLIALALSGLAKAQNDAYSAEVAVRDRSPTEQQSAYQVAMRAVLLRNSGDKTLLNRDDVRAGLRSAEQYVDSFSYRTPAPGSSISRDTPITDAVRQSGEATQFMLITFDPVRLSQLISPSGTQSASAGETENDATITNPFENVKSALVWIIVEDGGGQTLISGAAGGNVMQRAREIAGGAGMGLLFPAGDQIDQQAVPAEAIQNASVDVINAGASRYAPSVVLAAYLVRNRTGGWSGNWLKTAGVAQQNTITQSNSLDEALQQGLEWLNPAVGAGASADSVYAGASNAGSAAEALVWVGPLRSTASYAEVMAWFNAIPDVRTVYPKEILTNGMVFAITPRIAISAVSAAASTRTWLRQSATPTALSESRFAQDVVLNFEYNR